MCPFAKNHFTLKNDDDETEQTGHKSKSFGKLRTWSQCSTVLFVIWVLQASSKSATQFGAGVCYYYYYYFYYYTFFFCTRHFSVWLLHYTSNSLA